MLIVTNTFRQGLRTVGVVFQEVVPVSPCIKRLRHYCPLCGGDVKRCLTDLDMDRSARCEACKVRFSIDPLLFTGLDMFRVQECLGLKFEPTPEQPCYPPAHEEEEEPWWQEPPF